MIREIVRQKHHTAIGDMLHSGEPLLQEAAEDGNDFVSVIMAKKHLRVKCKIIRVKCKIIAVTKP